MNKLPTIRFWLLLIKVWFGASVTASAQLEILADLQSHQVFAGNARRIAIRLRANGEQPVTADIHLRLLQTSSATSVPIYDSPWRTLKLGPGQTMIDVAQVNFPAVKAETQFLIQWVEGMSNIVGRTEVRVYPTNLLVQLKALAGDEPLGLFDPTDELKPWLRSLAVEFQDLIEDGTDKFQGKLAIFGPFETKAQMRANLREDIRALAKRGVAVVWLQPPPEKHALLKPSFYVVREAEGAVVVAEHGLVAQLTERPEAQLNLLRLAEEALQPTSLKLPETETSN